MVNQSERDRKGQRLVLIAAVFAGLIAFCPHPAALSVAIGEAGVSVEMKLAFLNVAFDFGHQRPKMNSLRVLLG